MTKKKNLWPISQTWRGNFFDNGCMIRIMTVEIICPTKLATCRKTLSRKQRSMYNMLNGFKIILTNITWPSKITVAKFLNWNICQSISSKTKKNTLMILFYNLFCVINRFYHWNHISISLEMYFMRNDGILTRLRLKSDLRNIQKNTVSSNLRITSDFLDKQTS